MALKKDKLSDVCNCRDCGDTSSTIFTIGICVVGVLALLVIAAGLRAAAAL